MTMVLDKRQAIFDATLSLISENGFHGTSMSRVAKKAKVSTGIIYHYFTGKEELIHALYKDVANRAAQAFVAEFDETTSIPEQLKQIIRSALLYSVWHLEDSAFIEQYHRSPYYFAKPTQQNSEAHQIVVSVFAQAKEQRIIKDLPQTVLAAFTLDIGTSLAHKQANGRFNLTPAMTEQIVDSIWAAIRW